MTTNLKQSNQSAKLSPVSLRLHPELFRIVQIEDESRERDRSFERDVKWEVKREMVRVTESERAREREKE